MSTWIVFLILAVIFLLIEICTPTMFFLNFAFASVICAFFGIFTDSYNILIPLFVVLSILFLLFLRPLFNINSPKTEDSLDSQYRGKQATAITNINTLSGRIKIYDEDWEARLADENSDEIKKGQKVRIVNHDNLTMYVETTAKKGKK